MEKRYGNRFLFSDQGDVAYTKFVVKVFEYDHVLLITSET